MFVSDTSSRQSIFQDYIDDIVTELTYVSQIIQAVPVNLDDCIANRDSLQHFINHCLTKTNVDLSRTQALLKLDNQLFEDLIQPALRARLTASSSRV